MASNLATLNHNFNTTYRVGKETTDINDFNPRSRVGNDCKVGDTVYVPTRFQSTFPRGERPMCSLAEFRFSKFQSTFPRGERHLWFSLNRNRHMISIHVPAWGTTNIFLSTLVLIPISIHVPAWGTTSYSLMRTLAFVISIHVPAWGTTVCSGTSSVIYYNFNPRSRVGNDGLFSEKLSVLPNFNPRSRVGNDISSSA